MGVIVYTFSGSDPTVLRKQTEIINFLHTNKIEFEVIDLFREDGANDVMRKKIPEEIRKQNEANNKLVRPPQIFNGEEYCGDYDMFFNAREMGLLYTFFKVALNAEKQLAEYFE